MLARSATKRLVVVADKPQFTAAPSQSAVPPIPVHRDRRAAASRRAVFRFGSQETGVGGGAAPDIAARRARRRPSVERLTRPSTRHPGPSAECLAPRITHRSDGRQQTSIGSADAGSTVSRVELPSHIGERPRGCNLGRAAWGRTSDFSISATRPGGRNINVQQPSNSRMIGTLDCWSLQSGP